MGRFATLFQQAAATARTLLHDDLFLPCEYQPAPGQISYDAASGRPVWHDPPPGYVDVQLLLANYSREERQDTTIQNHDARALIAGVDLPVTPKPGDVVRTQDGRVWEVIKATDDPALALWDMQLRPYVLGWPPEWP